LVVVIRIKPINDISCSPLNTFVDGMTLAIIRFADPVGQVFFVFLNDINGAISATTIDDDVFNT
jgi:hypothetical protein